MHIIEVFIKYCTGLWNLWLPMQSRMTCSCCSNSMFTTIELSVVPSVPLIPFRWVDPYQHLLRVGFTHKTSSGAEGINRECRSKLSVEALRSGLGHDDDDDSWVCMCHTALPKSCHGTARMPSQITRTVASRREKFLNTSKVKQSTLTFMNCALNCLYWIESVKL